jgi:hypothetical protein
MQGSDAIAHLVKSLENTELGSKGRYRETLREEFLRRGQERMLAGAPPR